MKLAQIQMRVQPDKAENLRHAEALLASVKGADMAVLPEDPDFGDFPLSRGCILEYLDLSVPKDVRAKDPFLGWRRVTYDELVAIVQDIRARTSP